MMNRRRFMAGLSGAGAAFLAGADAARGQVLAGFETASMRGSIVGHRWSKPATGDLARIGDGGFSHLTVARNHVG